MAARGRRKGKVLACWRMKKEVRSWSLLKRKKVVGDSGRKRQGLAVRIGVWSTVAGRKVAFPLTERQWRWLRRHRYRMLAGLFFHTQNAAN